MFAYLNNGFVDGKYQISILVSSNGKGVPNARITVQDSKGLLLEQRTNKNGDFFFNPTKTDNYFMIICIDSNGAESCTDRKVVYMQEPNITITRRGSTYTICSNYDFGQFEIVDLNRLNIVQQTEGCGRYSTDSERFLVRTAEHGLLEPIEIEAGRFVKVQYPEKVLVDNPFYVYVYENSIPLQDARVEIGGISKITDSKGVVSYVLKTATTYDVKASKEGLLPFNGKITAVSEWERFNVSHPEKVKPLEVFEVKVSYQDQPVSNAVVSVGNIKKPTDAEGKAAFAIADKGSYLITVEKEGFEKR
ncbi:MAG: hypothetical protein QXM75_00905, partial [Candidatus Diapherotrites archaeon]